MKRPFEVGERVMTYGQSFTGDLQVETNRGHTGVIVAIKGEWLIVRVDTGPVVKPPLSFHYRQCRRLLKKKRRQWWLARHPHSGKWMVFDYDPHNIEEPSPEVVHVIEAPKEKE